MMECVNCKCPLGPEAGEMPFTAHDGETWCPQCFGHKRAPMEPARYYPPGYNAVKCASCGLITVAIGSFACTQCNSTHTVLLPAKPEVGLGDTGGMTKVFLSRTPTLLPPKAR